MLSDWKGESLIMSLELQSKGITLSVKKKNWLSTGSFKLRKNIYKFGEKSSSGKRKSFFATLNYNNGRMELQQKQNENTTIVLE